MTNPRTEDDLRAAFALAAQEAPATDGVLARLRAAEHPPVTAARRSRFPRWAPIAAAAAVVIAVGVPIAIVQAGGSSKTSSASSSGSAKFSAPSAAASGAAGDSAVSGPAHSAPGLVSPNEKAPSAGVVCQPGDVALALTWTATSSGLQGTVTARNTSSIACDLAVKPSVYPLDAKRVRLPVQNIMSAEGYAGPSRLLPNATASSTITWPSWCGAKADSGAQIDWGVGPVTVTVTGPTTPSCVSGQSANISSGWFSPLS
jgi:hypothetical protein